MDIVFLIKIKLIKIVIKIVIVFIDEIREKQYMFRLKIRKTIMNLSIFKPNYV